MQSSREGSDFPTETSPIILEFPTIPVRGTPARWLSYSQLVNMTSQHHDDSSCDEATSSLGDSAYDLIDDRSVFTTDDEEHDAMTASTASSDGQESDRSYSRRLGTLTQPPGQTQPLLPSQIRGSRQRLSSPPLESRKVYNGRPGSLQEPIKFEEPSLTNPDSNRITEVGFVLTTIDSQELSDVLHSQSRLDVTLRQSVASRPLDLEGKSYKVLYFGELAFKDLVIQKIATALAASRRTSPRSSSPRASKFNVVPISSFGDETNPEVVLIDSSGLEMTVEECKQAAFIETPDGNDILEMTLTDDCTVRSSWDGSKLVVSDNWTLPDIAIFCISESDKLKSKRTHGIARSFMRRHAVQSIIISETSQWKKCTDILTLDTSTPHVCLEYWDKAMARPHILKRQPIDLNTFLRIDAGQMNRSLACLDEANRHRIGMQSKKQRYAEIIAEDNGPFENLVARCPRWFQRYYDFVKGMVDLPFAWSLMGLLIVSVGFARLAIYSSSGIYDFGSSGLSLTASRLPKSSFPIDPTSTATPTTLVNVPSYTSSLPTPVSPVTSLSTDIDLASFLLDHSNPSPSKLEKFKVYILGDCHIIMRPPHWFTKLKKIPPLLFRILRKESPLEHKVINLFDGVYALQIPREHAYGLLNVDIWTTSGPTINKTFEVDFGSSWLKLAVWKRATRALGESFQTELSQAQDSLSVVYDKTKTELSTIVQKRSEALARQKELEQASIACYFRQSLKTKDLMVALTKDLTRHLSRKFHNSSTAASKRATIICKGIAEEFIWGTRNKSVMILDQARILTHAVADVDVRALLHGARYFQLKHIRGTQKAVLKLWWKFRGLPKSRVVKIRGKDGCRTRRDMSIGEEV